MVSIESVPMTSSGHRCSTGLLLLFGRKRLSAALTTASKHVTQTLYVHHDDHKRSPVSSRDIIKRHSDHMWSLYTNAYKVCPLLDVRLLMTNFKDTEAGGQLPNKKVDVLLTNTTADHLNLTEHLKKRFAKGITDDANVVDIDGQSEDDEVDRVDNDGLTNTWTLHDNVCLGGTFDRLHIGHKILLSEAVLLCRKRLVVGVTVDGLNKNKVLYELIEPIEDRIKALRDFLQEIDLTLDYDIVPIHDPFGPTTTDETIQCIVVSKETLNGGRLVNVERRKKGMNELVIHTINLLAEDENELKEQDKLSSTALRMKTLGKRKHFSIDKPDLPKRPYIIGLTGGIASGKSSIAKRLRDLGAGVIDSDRLGHEAYSIGTNVYDRIVDRFGSELVSSDGQIDRKILAAKVFENRDELDWLNALVWPEIRRLKDERVNQLWKKGFEVIVVEAALMVESGWFRDVHELWVSIIPRNEAVKRIVERDRVDESAAEQRIDRQTTNKVRLEHANVVFCTLWDQQYTQTQVERAWSDLQIYLRSASQS